MRKLTGYLIRANGEHGRRTIDNTFEAIRALIGAKWLQPICSGREFFYLDEEGKLKGLPENTTAVDVFSNHFAGELLVGDYLVGDVFITGLPDEQGNDTDLDVATLVYLEAKLP